MSIIYFYALKFTFNSPVRIYGIRSVKYDSIKGQVLYIQTLTAQVEAPSLETSKFSLYFSGSCIPINPKLSHIFPPEFLVVFNRFQCKKVANFRREIPNTLFIFCNNCQACVELTLEIQRTICR